MTSPRTRLLSVVASLALLTPAALVAASGPAHAESWTNLFRIHQSITQACKTPAGGNGWEVRFRNNNKQADHAHITGFQVNRGSRELQDVQVQAGAGRVSAVKSVVVRRPTSDTLVGGMGELDGRGLGDTVGLGELTRC